MDSLERTPWFNAQQVGPPVRPGVYEGTFVGKPGDGFVAFHGFYLWDGMHWVGFGDRPDAIRRSSHRRVTYWRGVIPGKEYPFAQVAKPQWHYSGVLDRTRAPDKLIVHRLTIKGNEMVVAITRERGGRAPEKYETVLYNAGDGFVGSSKIRIGNFTADQPAQIRVPSFVEASGQITLSLMLQGVTQDWHSFHGVLSSDQ